MTQPTPARVRRCPDCDGFPVVAIDTGTRHADGTRATLRITCTGCDGTGTVSRPARLTTPVGR
ncbi:hypothetical protein GCM10012287_50920 [Streptomyces daqingensis]|uniref:Uncharacterized protein n=1 Tax=Streptomyces daqingensis TaxID=1472640 RepID=A0ABQ2MQ75_9ACTN|nr:hypothetical protein [Streptomyces daqingensis]GGO56713.1 hypothetical protein GCM10012287_50920 [Streptomyces daqingensis]